TEPCTKPSLRVLTWNCSMGFETVQLLSCPSSSSVSRDTVSIARCGIPCGIFLSYSRQAGITGYQIHSKGTTRGALYSDRGIVTHKPTLANIEGSVLMRVFDASRSS